MATITEMPLEDRNQEFLDSESKIDDAIKIQKRKRPNVWSSLSPHGTYKLGEGLTKKSYRFWSGLSQQRGLHLWHPVQISRKATAGDPGYDSTKYNPHTVTYGFDSLTYGGMGIEYKTPHISIRDLRFGWQVNEQLRAIYGFLGNFTNDMWANYHREQYAKSCNAAGQCFVVTDGQYDSQTFVYDPEYVDEEGDNIAVVDGKNRIPFFGTLDWDQLQVLARKLQMAVPESAITTVDGRPAFGWVGDVEDFHTMIKKDEELRKDWREGQVMKLINGYGSTTTYQSFSLMHDIFTPRFDIKSVSGNVVTFKRVDPEVATATSLIGERTNINRDYLNAEFGAFFIYLKDVSITEVPPSGPGAPGGGTSFGTSPGLNGMWKWLNFASDENPLQEKGRYFMRAEGFEKPLDNFEHPVMIIYRRWTHKTVKDTSIGGSAAASEQALIADVAADDVDANNNTIAVELAGYITSEAGEEITLVADDASTKTGIVKESSSAPSYVLAMDEAVTATNYTAAGGAKVTVG